MVKLWKSEGHVTTLLIKFLCQDAIKSLIWVNEIFYFVVGVRDSLFEAIRLDRLARQWYLNAAFYLSQRALHYDCCFLLWVLPFQQLSSSRSKKEKVGQHMQGKMLEKIHTCFKIHPGLILASHNEHETKNSRMFTKTNKTKRNLVHDRKFESLFPRLPLG